MGKCLVYILFNRKKVFEKKKNVEKAIVLVIDINTTFSIMFYFQ